jgi:hypothetical protein
MLHKQIAQELSVAFTSEFISISMVNDNTTFIL